MNWKFPLIPLSLLKHEQFNCPDTFLQEQDCKKLVFDEHYRVGT